MSKERAKYKSYRSDPYWEKETPEVVQTDRLIISYFPKAGKLQISRAYKDKDTGELVRGKTVTLDQEDIALNPAAKELILRALEEWE